MVANAGHLGVSEGFQSSGFILNLDFEQPSRLMQTNSSWNSATRLSEIKDLTARTEHRIRNMRMWAGLNTGY